MHDVLSSMKTHPVINGKSTYSLQILIISNPILYFIF